MDENIGNWVIIDSIEFLTSKPFPEESINKLENPSYYLLIGINDDNKPKKTSPFNLNPNEKNTIDLKIKIQLNTTLSKIRFELFKSNGKELLHGGLLFSNHKIVNSDINSLKCCLGNTLKEKIAIIKLTYIINSKDALNQDTNNEIHPFDVYDNYMQYVEKKSKASNKGDKTVMNIIKDKNFSILDLATGSNTENFNMFVHNMDYIRAILNEVVDLVQWKNPYKTFSILSIITLLFYYSSFLILVATPLLLIFFHICNKDELITNYSYKKVSSDKVANLHLIMWIIELTNNIINGYESLLEAIQAVSGELALEVYFNIIKFVFLNIMSLILFNFTVFQINVKLFIVVSILLIFLYQYPPFQAFCFVLLRILNKSLSNFDHIFIKINSNVSSKKFIKNVFIHTIPFLDTGLKLYSIAINKDDLSLDKVVKDLASTPSKVVIPDSEDVNSGKELLKYELLEKERWWLALGWKKKLFSSDGPTWQKIDSDEYCDIKMVMLPDNEEYHWNSEWKIELSSKSDDQGWEYGSDFKNKEDFGSKKATKYVRKRKWVRYAIKNK